jgi:hypothetical protein
MGKYLDLIRELRIPPSGDINGPKSLRSMEMASSLLEDSPRSSGDPLRTCKPQGATTETTLTTKVPQPGLTAGAATTETTKAPVLEMPLNLFEVEGHPIEIVVPDLTETLWFVPTEDHALVLGSRGIRRGRIWTAAELRAVAAMPQASRDELLTMAKVKARFDGEVIEIRETPCP